MGLGSSGLFRGGASVRPCSDRKVGRCCGIVGIGATSYAGGEETRGLRWYLDILLWIASFCPSGDFAALGGGGDLLAAACLTDLYREYLAGGEGSESADMAGYAQRLFALEFFIKSHITAFAS